MGTPESEEQAAAWVAGTLADLHQVPVGTVVYRAALDCLAQTVERYPAALVLVRDYEQARERRAATGRS